MDKNRSSVRKDLSNLNRLSYTRVIKLLLVISIYTFYLLFLSSNVEKQLAKLILNRSNENAVERQYLVKKQQKLQNNSITFSSINRSYSNSIQYSSEIVTTDPRILALERYLIDHSSPMYPYAEVFIEEADKYGLDWRLVPSIAGVESAYGNLIPPNSHNAWGWKGDPTREWSHFTSWTHGITVVTRGLAEGYGTDLSPFDIESTYCPPCGENPQHAWANGVSNNMYEIEFYLEKLE
jgi:hypothetical protein